MGTKNKNTLAKKRILVLHNHFNAPPKKARLGEFDPELVDWIAEFDVIACLKEVGHDVLPLALKDDLGALRDTIENFNPHLAFNLLVEFAGRGDFDQHIVSYLELLGVPCTGSPPKALAIARDKALCKKLFMHHNILTPQFELSELGKAHKAPSNLKFPLIVKCATEEASLGMTQASVVQSEAKLKERIAHIHTQFGCDALVEEFVEGRELFVGVLGNKRPQTLPVWELCFQNSEAPEKEFYHTQAKWHTSYRNRKGIHTKKAALSKDLDSQIQNISKQIYKLLGIQGYARIDFRLSTSGDLYVLEANPNADISTIGELSQAAQEAGLTYPQLLKKIIGLAL